jgi:hypothetical protein
MSAVVLAYPDRCESCGFPSDNIHQSDGHWLCFQCGTQPEQPEPEREPEVYLSSVPSGSSGSKNQSLVVSAPEPSGTSGCINRLGKLPNDATADMRTVAADFARALSEHRERRPELPMPYSTGWCAERCGWIARDRPDKGRASRAINALVRAGIFECVGALRPRGKPNGTKLYAEPGTVDHERVAA